MGARWMAWMVAGSHLAFVAFLIAGGFLAWRKPKLVKWHVGAIVATAVVNITGSDCPLTVWEKWFLRQAGDDPYETGFISHYLVEPIYRPGINGRVNFVLLVSLIVPITISYWRLRKMGEATQIA